MTKPIQTYHTFPIHKLEDDENPTLSEDLDLNHNSIEILPKPIKDHSSSGLVGKHTTGEGLVFGELCYYKSDGKYWKTDADAESTTKGDLAICIKGKINADTTYKFLEWGYIRDDSWSFTKGAELYVSTTAGGITETAPSTTTEYVRIIGYAHETNIVKFFPDNTYIKVS